METKTYIALVMVTAFVDGQRVEIPPGKALPDGISEHDLAQLLRMKAIEDTAAASAADKAAVKEEKAAAAEFAAEKKAAMAAHESSADPDQTTAKTARARSAGAKAST